CAESAARYGRASVAAAREPVREVEETDVENLGTSLLLGRRGLLTRCLPLNDEVGGRSMAGIPDPVHLIRCLKDDRPRADLAANAIEGGLDGPFLDQY